EGQGSQFWFTAAVAPARAARQTAAARPSLAGMRVLVVDDNAINREILEKQLAAWDAEVETLADPEAAVGILTAATRDGSGFAAAVLDHAMPGLDGVALARLIRAEPDLAGLRLVLASSSADPEVRRSAPSLGIAAVLIKPCPPSGLYAALAEVGPAAREAT